MVLIKKHLKNKGCNCWGKSWSYWSWIWEFSNRHSWDLTDISKVIKINSNDADLLNFEINTYEEIASNNGIIILNTDGNGNYDILNKFVDSTDLKNTDIQTLRFEVSGVAPNSSESSLINQFVFEVSDTNSEPSEVLETKSIVPKIEEIEYNGSVTQTFIFSIPSLSNNQTLKLLTPDNYDDEVSFDVYTVVSANGDTAISQTPASLKVTVFSDGSPAEVSTSESIAIEDGPAFRLPITVTLKDTSENITSLKLESSNLEEVLYLTRLQNLTLDAHNSSLNHLGDDLDLIIRFSGNFKTSLEGDQEGELTLEQQIKDEFNSDDEFSVMVSNLEALLQSFGLNQNTHWNFYAKGKVLDSDGLEETVYQQLSFRDDQDVWVNYRSRFNKWFRPKNMYQIQLRYLFKC